MTNAPSTPEAIAAAVQKLSEAHRARERVPTFFSNYAHWLAQRGSKLGPALTETQAYRALAAPILVEILRSELPRFQSYQERKEASRELAEQGLLDAGSRVAGSEIPKSVMAKSQGSDRCYSWRGISAFKSVFDIGIYAALLWDLKPKTIIELGSGEGGGAALLADLARGFGLDCHVLSIDIEKPDLLLDNVTFLEGDLREPGKILTRAELDRLAHPWLLIEDAHKGVAESLSHFGAAAHAGDYFIVEDSANKAADIEDFLERSRSDFYVDGKYTDMFGWNATSAIDSIFVCQGEEV